MVKLCRCTLYHDPARNETDKYAACRIIKINIFLFRFGVTQHVHRIRGVVDRVWATSCVCPVQSMDVCVCDAVSDSSITPVIYGGNQNQETENHLSSHVIMM